MNRTLSIILFFIFTLGYAFEVQGQSSRGQYFIGFSDKSNTPYSLSQPNDYLSPVSITRRQNQGLAIDVSDLPVDPSYLQTLAAVPGVRLMHPIKWINGAVVYVGDSTQLTAMAAFPFVDELVFLSPAEPGFGPQSPGKMADTLSAWPYSPSMLKEQSALINLDYLHEIGYQGNGKTIAVIDAGFTSADTMSSFARMRLLNPQLASKDFVDPGTSVYKASSHGTFVLSIMATYIESQYVGTAPDASYILLRSENAATEYLVEEYLWMAAAEYADSAGADIINSSLGYTDFDDTSQNHTYQTLDGNTAIVTRAADMAASKGMLVIVSAGNSGNSPWFYIGAPADADSVLAVGAVDSKGSYAVFSSKGPRVDGHVKPDIAATGWKTEFVDLNGTVQKGNGTSFASPMIAGAAACLWQSAPHASAMQVREAIILSSSQYTNPDSLLGYGIPDMLVAMQLLSGHEIPDIESDDTLFTYPNPFDSKIVIVFSAANSGTMNITLSDRIGRTVYSSEIIEYQKGYNSFQIKGTDHLASGIYMLCLKSEGAVRCRKILK